MKVQPMWPSAKVRNRFDGYHRVNATYLHYLKTTLALGECEEDDTNQHSAWSCCAAGGSIFFLRGGGL